MEFKNSLFNKAFYLINSSNIENSSEDYYSLIQGNANFNDERRFHFKANIEDYKKAIDLFDEFLEINPNCKIAYNYRGVSKLNIKDYQGAILDYSKAIEINPNYASAFFNKGNVRMVLKEYEEAIKEYSNAISLNKNNAKYYDLRGIAKQELDDFSGALEDFKEVIELAPTDYLSYAYVAFAKYDLKNEQKVKAFQDSKRAYNQIIESKTQVFTIEALKNWLENNRELYKYLEEDENSMLSSLYRSIGGFQEIFSILDRYLKLINPELPLLEALEEYHQLDNSKESFVLNWLVKNEELYHKVKDISFHIDSEGRLVIKHTELPREQKYIEGDYKIFTQFENICEKHYGVLYGKYIVRCNQQLQIINNHLKHPKKYLSLKQNLEQRGIIL